MKILGHDGDSFRVDRTEVGILEQTDKVSFSCFLKCEDSLRLESYVVFHLHRDVSYESLEGKFANKQVRRLLILADFSERDCARSELVGLLHSSSGRC